MSRKLPELNDASNTAQKVGLFAAGVAARVIGECVLVALLRQLDEHEQKTKRGLFCRGQTAPTNMKKRVGTLAGATMMRASTGHPCANSNFSGRTLRRSEKRRVGPSSAAQK